MYINTFQYKPEHVDCRLCTEYAGKKKDCTAKTCPWLAERIEAGVVGYKEAVMETFPRNVHTDARLHTAIRRFSGSLFLTAAHYQRMERMKVRQGYRRRRDTPAYYAAMYLLTANEDICTRATNCFCRYGIEFDYATTQDMVSLLRRSSNNLNQLTRRVHETGRFYGADLDELRQSYDSLWDAAQKILTSLAKLQ